MECIYISIIRCFIESINTGRLIDMTKTHEIRLKLMHQFQKIHFNESQINIFPTEKNRISLYFLKYAVRIYKILR